MSVSCNRPKKIVKRNRHNKCRLETKAKREMIIEVQKVKE